MRAESQTLGVNEPYIVKNKCRIVNIIILLFTSFIKIEYDMK